MGKCKCSRKHKCCCGNKPQLPLVIPVKQSAGVTSSQVTIFVPPDPPILMPMQAVQVDTSLGTGAFQYAQFDEVLYDTSGLWDQSAFAFRIRKTARYNVSIQLTYFVLLNDGSVYPDANFIMFEVRDSNENPKETSYVVGAPGTPLFFDFGTGIISPMATSGILNLNAGDVVRVRAKSVYTSGPYPNTLLLLGQISISTSAILAGSAGFSICEC